MKIILRMLLIALLLSCGIALKAEDRTYHKITVADCATTKWTHVELTGTVTLVKKEGDGDIHIRLEDGKNFCVAEIIPELPLDKPHVGEVITVQGISRVDKTHGWGEVHPIEHIHTES